MEEAAMPLFASLDNFPISLQEAMKLLFSASSLVVTAYFWFVRVNRERTSIAFYAVNGFEGALEPHGLGVWTGKVFLANRSILPTAIVQARAELWWGGSWRTGNAVAADGSELPWNLPSAQVFAKNITAVFDLGPDTSREQVYANQKLRFTFETVDGSRVVWETNTDINAGKAVLASPEATQPAIHRTAA
jgi:hypothetical protein